MLDRRRKVRSYPPLSFFRIVFALIIIIIVATVVKNRLIEQHKNGPHEQQPRAGVGGGHGSEERAVAVLDVAAAE